MFKDEGDVELLTIFDKGSIGDEVSEGVDNFKFSSFLTFTKLRFSEPSNSKLVSCLIKGFVSELMQFD